MTLRDRYDIPAEVLQEPHSPAFKAFLWNWFGNETQLARGELSLDFLRDLTPHELQLARSILRNNLTLGYPHLLEGAVVLHDVSAIPVLRTMLNSERDLSLQLTICAALWE